MPRYLVNLDCFRSALVVCVCVCVEGVREGKQLVEELLIFPSNSHSREVL